MIVWINGAHGAGKTSVARRLAKLIPNARIVDPEEIGFMIRRIWPRPLPNDFKDMPVWRELSLATLRAAAAADPAMTLIVPMTLAAPGHFGEIVGGLREAGVEVSHVTLTAAPETLRRRLRWRFDWPSSRRWSLREAGRSAAALASPQFAPHLATDGRSVPQVAEEIIGLLRPAD